MRFLAWGVMNLFFWLWLFQKRIKNCDPNFFYLYYRKLQKWFISSFFNEKSNIWPQFWKKSFLYVAQNQISYTRWLYKRIYKTEMKFWVVLGSQGCREKNLPTAISKQLFQVFFVGKRIFWKFSKNIFASALKSYII